jgi:mono/diheme cytochrome c family protein
MPTAHTRDLGFPEAQTILQTYCKACHGGTAHAGGFSLNQIAAPESLYSASNTWNRIMARVRVGEMPPKGRPAPSPEEREALLAWGVPTLRAAACQNGLAPGPYPMRRLSRDEYGATIRDLLNVHFNAGHGLPADGAGGEGFDNASETLFLSPIHAEKYLDAAAEALDYGAKDPRSRKSFLIAEPDQNTPPEEAARKVLEAFVPRAFRRPAKTGEVDRYLNLFRTRQKRGDNFDRAILFALKGVLVSPNFLFRMEDPNPQTGPRPLDDYAFASRLSYFLWGSMPDQALFDLAAEGRLQDDAVVTEQIGRMLKDQRVRDFSERFVDQWLNTRELGRDIKPDEKIFPAYYDAEIQSAIRYEPILFFQEILSQNLSVLNLLDSNFTILTNKLSNFYGLSLKGLTQQPKRAELPENSHRGGILNMSAVLAVSSYPQRTSPVLRGKWILEAVLGTPPPPPPPNVPDLKEDDHSAAAARTLRERLEEHRRDPVCASCHSRIDPLGFALENYDALGRWRTEDSGKPIDNRGELPDGTKIEGPERLKKVLLERKPLFLRHLTSKLMGYALGRGLTAGDACTVDRILDQLESQEYRSQALMRSIVLSVPFRYQAGTIANRAVQEGIR